MKRNLLALALISAIATQASAVLNLNLTNPEGTYSPSASAQTYTLVGSLTGLNTDASTFTVSSAAGATIALDPTFAAYLATTTLNPYTGNIAVVTITGGTNAVIDGSQSFVTVGDANGISDNEFFRLTPVPEPSAFAALGLGVVALVRRRRRA